MGIKSADQITIIDVTDAYSVMLTSEAYTFIGDTSGVPVGQTCSTEVVAFCGTSQCNSVNVTAGDIVCPTGITAKVENSGTTKVKITFTTAAVISTACEATIPIVVDGITVNKKFSFAVAKAGIDGQPGKDGTNGQDAISMVITASNGTVFKNNSGSTVLTAHVFVGGIEQTITASGECRDLGVVKWYKGNNQSTPVAISKTYTISAADVLNSEIITVQLEK